MKLPASILKRAKATGAPAAPMVKVPRGMNKLERDYRDHLQARVQAGDVEWFGFQSWRLCIATAGRRRFYTPDFVVKFRGGYTEFHETKGFMREAAALRIAVAASQYPYSFVVVRRDGGEWTWQTIVVGEVRGGA